MTHEVVGLDRSGALARGVLGLEADEQSAASERLQLGTHLHRVVDRRLADAFADACILEQHVEGAPAVELDDQVGRGARDAARLRAGERMHALRHARHQVDVRREHHARQAAAENPVGDQAGAAAAAGDAAEQGAAGELARHVDDQVGEFRGRRIGMHEGGAGGECAAFVARVATGQGAGFRRRRCSFPGRNGRPARPARLRRRTRRRWREPNRRWRRPSWRCRCATSAARRFLRCAARADRSGR